MDMQERVQVFFLQVGDNCLTFQRRTHELRLRVIDGGCLKDKGLCVFVSLVDTFLEVVFFGEKGSP